MTEERDIDPRWDGTSIPRDHWHFHRRLLERYGIVLAPGEFSMILKAIRKGRAVKVAERPDKTAIYSIRIMSVGERIYLVADGERLVTVLAPQRALNKRRKAAALQSAKAPPTV